MAISQNSVFKQVSVHTTLVALCLSAPKEFREQHTCCDEQRAAETAAKAHSQRVLQPDAERQVISCSCDTGGGLHAC